MLFRALSSDEVRIDCEAAAIGLFATGFAGIAYESLHIAYLGPERRLIAERRFRSDMCDSIEMPLRTIIREALVHDATGLIIAHNHPSGDASPSRADLIATRALADLGRPLGIRLHDHLIFAGVETRSLHAMGLL